MKDRNHDPDRFYHCRCIDEGMKEHSDAFYHCDCLEGGYIPPTEREKELIDIIRLYDRNDCPVCFADNKLVDQKVDKVGKIIVHSGGRWHTEHTEDCKIGKAIK